jgi:hypothetical protein
MSGDGRNRTCARLGANERRSQSASPGRDRVRTGGVEPPQSVTLRLQRSELARAQRPHGGSSAGGIRTHDLERMKLARTASPPPRDVLSGRLESNQRSPIPETGGALASPTARGSRRRPQRPPGSRRPWSRTTRDRRIRAAPAQPARRRKLRLGSEPRPRPRDSRPPSGPFALPRDRNPHSRIPVLRRDGASPGNRTLLHGLTTRGLATSLATQSRREESNPRRPR